MNAPRDGLIGASAHGLLSKWFKAYAHASNILGYLFLLTIFWIPIGSSVKVIYEPVLASLLGLCVWCIVTYEDRLLPHPVWRPILHLGQISYPVYLLHQIFVPYVRSAVEPGQTHLNFFNGLR